MAVMSNSDDASVGSLADGWKRNDSFF